MRCIVEVVAVVSQQYETKIGRQKLYRVQGECVDNAKFDCGVALC